MKPEYKDIGTIETRTIDACSMLIHILLMVQEFGWDDKHPVTNKTNVQRTLSEIRAVRRCIDILEEHIMENTT